MFMDDAGEYRLLGSIIDDPDTVLLYSSDLFTGTRARLFEAMRRSYLAWGELSSEGVEQFFGSTLPPELEMARGSKSAAVIDRLTDLATKRQLSEVINKLTVALANPNINRGDIQKLLTMPDIITKDSSDLSSGIVQFVSDLQRKRSGQYQFVRTGLPFLDHMLGGEWPRQALTVVIGQAGGGKTALVVQSILNMAIAGLSSLFISLEMPRDRIISRLVANISSIDGMRLKSGIISDDESAQVDDALRVLQGLNSSIHIVDRPGMPIEDIVYQIKRHKELHNIQAVFVDYIQIIGRPPNDKNTDSESLGYLAQQLRNTAVDLDISVIVLSQQNRGFQGLQSILGSGRIGHIADTVFEIELDAGSTNDDQRMCRLIFHKNRDGAVGESNTIYRPRYLRFEG